MKRMIPWKRNHVNQRESLNEPVETFQGLLDRLFDSRFFDTRTFFDSFDSALAPWSRTSLLDSAWSPALDVYDHKDHLLVKADLPGMNKEDIDISLEGDTLILKGEKKEEKNVGEKGSVRSERFYGSFTRAVSLPCAVDSSQAKASYKNGVLELSLPKREEAKPKQIKIDLK